MGESAVLAHSYSFAAPITRTDSHEDNTIHALSQSISFGKFMSENLEWGKWSTFSHKKYVEEAEKYSRPGSVAQKKAFFEAHYKRIADAKKAVTEEQPTVTPAEVLLHTLETQPPLSLLPEEEPLERKSDVLVVVDDSFEEKKQQEDEEEDCPVVVAKEKTKNKPVFRLSLEKTIPPAKSLEIASSDKTSERPMIQSSGVQRQKFSFLSCFIGNAKTRDQNQSMRKTERKNQKKKFMCLCLKPKTVRDVKARFIHGGRCGRWSCYGLAGDN